jgi:hypothetical protein
MQNIDVSPATYRERCLDFRRRQALIPNSIDRMYSPRGFIGGGIRNKP